MALRIAQKYEGTLENDEVISSAFVGLVKSAHKFEPGKGFKFSTFATKCIENEILMQIRREKKTKRNISINALVSLDENGKSIRYEDILYDDNALKVFEELENNDLIHCLLEKLSEREKIIVCLWCAGEKQKVIAEKTGLKQPRISRILHKSFKKMRESV